MLVPLVVALAALGCAARTGDAPPRDAGPRYEVHGDDYDLTFEWDPLEVKGDSIAVAHLYAGHPVMVFGSDPDIRVHRLPEWPNPFSPTPGRLIAQLVNLAADSLAVTLLTSDETPVRSLYAGHIERGVYRVDLQMNERFFVGDAGLKPYWVEFTVGAASFKQFIMLY